MNVGSLFLSLGIKGDTKSLDDAIKKVEELRKKTEALNKELKDSEKIKKESSSSGKTRASKDPELAELKRTTQFKIQEHKQARETLKTEKEAVKLKAESAKTEKENAKLKAEFSKKEIFENKEKDRQFDRAARIAEKEQKKREKSREKATKDFFNQVENGFSFIAKAFTGGLVAGGVGGFIASQAASKVSLAASLQQYGIDPEKSQRYANVFRRASGGQVGDSETNSFIANLSEQIAQGLTTNPEILSKFAILGIDPRKVTDFDSALREIRNYSKSENYNPANLTSLLGQLGVPKEFAPAFGKNFSDEQFTDAYNNAKISTSQEVKSATEVNLKIAEFVKAVDVFSGIILDRFKPDIEKFLKFIEDKLTPENLKEAAEIVEKGAAGFLTYKGIKFAVKNPKAAAGLAAAAVVYGQKNLMDEHAVKRINGKIVSNEEFKAFKERKIKKESGEYVADFGNFEVSDRLKTDPNRVYSQDEIAAAIKQTQISPSNNVNTTVNINAGSVDKNTAPFIANEINSNVNKSLYNSKYPTLSVPK